MTSSSWLSVLVVCFACGWAAHISRRHHSTAIQHHTQDNKQEHPPPSFASGEMEHQGTLEKFMLPCWARPVSYGTTTKAGVQVRCVEHGSPKRCVPFTVRVPESGQPTGLALYFHPNAEDLGSAPPFLENILKDKFSLAVVTMEYPGYGQANGSATHSQINAAADAMFDHVVNEWKVPPNRIVLVGFSIGTAVAASLARRQEQNNREVGGVVLLAPFSSIRSLVELKAKQAFPTLAKLAEAIPTGYWDTTNDIKSVKSPVFVSYSSRDGVIPSSEPISLINSTAGSRLTVKQLTDTEVLAGVEFKPQDDSIPPELFHSLVPLPTLSSQDFVSWFDRLELSKGDKLEIKSNDRELVDVAFPVGEKRPIDGVEINSLSGIVQSLYSDKLFSEQTSSDWRGMASEFAWQTVLGN